MAITEVGICNSALVKVGCERIVSLDDDLVRARIVKEQYPKIRDKVLEAFPWTFAQKRAALAINATAPEWGYDNKYNLPSDFKRITETEYVFDHVIEGNYLLTDESEVNIKYTATVSDPGLFSANFAEAVATALAADVAYVLVQSKELADSLEAKYAKLIAEARSSNSQGRGTPRQAIVSEFLDSRN